MTNPYLDPHAATPPPQPQQPSNPPMWKKVLALVSLGFGALLILMGPASESMLFGLLAGIAVAFPGAWWLLHIRREKKGAPPMKRHWGIISIASIVMFFVGATFLPEPEPTNDQSSLVPSSSSSAPTTSEETSTSEEPATTTSETSETPTTESAEPTTEAETTTSSQPVAPTPNDDDDDVNRPYVPSARQPAPIRQQPAPVAPRPAPQPAYEPPAPADGTVHPGAFCSGGTGVSKTGKPMVCAPAKDGRNRWQSAG